MNMTTNIDNIPLKTNKNDIEIDDSDDPIVKDILNEFEKELRANTNVTAPISVPQKDYVINYQQPTLSCPVPMKRQKSSGYYNEEYLRKSAIIVIIIAIIFSPIIFSIFFDKLPESFKDIFDNYNYYIKLSLSFATIYLLFYYNLL